MHQMTLRQLLAIPRYRAYFKQDPHLRPVQKKPGSWYLYVQVEEEGAWKRKTIDSYKEGFDFIRQKLKSIHDGSITSRCRAYLPPVYRPQIEGKTGLHSIYWAQYPLNHKWCPYCRRPTLFKDFKRHHADGEIRRVFGLELNGRRCSICGNREATVTAYTTLGHDEKQEPIK